MKRIISLLVATAFALLSIIAPTYDYAYAAGWPYGLGDGSDGALTVSATTYTDNTRTTLSSTASAGATSLTVASTTGFAANDEVLIIDMKGNSAGAYEAKVISSIGSGVLNLTQGIDNSYNTSTDTIMVLLIPQYTTVTVNNGGTLTAHAWDGSTGGVVCFRASGALTINSGGTISASAIGYRGGTAASSGPEIYNGTVTSGGGGGGGGATGHNGTSYGNYYPGKGADGAMGGQVSYSYQDDWAPTYWNVNNHGAENKHQWTTSATRIHTTHLAGYTENMGGVGGDGITGGGGGGGGGGYAGFHGGTGGNGSTAGYGGGPSTDSGTAADENGTNGASGGGGGGGGADRDCGGGGGGGRALDAGSNDSISALTSLRMGGGASAGAGGGGGGGGGDYTSAGGGAGGSKNGTGGARGTDTSNNNSTAGANGADGNPGGGIILICADTITNSGSITANGGAGGAGGAGGNGSTTGNDGGAGGAGGGGNGGAGGSIRIIYKSGLSGANNISVNGGAGGAGGAGGNGNISGEGGAGATGSSGSSGYIRGTGITLLRNATIRNVTIQ